MIYPTAHIENGARIGSNCTIMSGVYIGTDAVIGDNVLLYPNVCVYRDCVLGNNVMIHSGSVVGSDGFGYAHTKTGEHIKLYQNGNVIIEHDVEIGANTTIDCAVFGSTLIKHGSKIDNLDTNRAQLYRGRTFYYSVPIRSRGVNDVRPKCRHGGSECDCWSSYNCPFYNFSCTFRCYKKYH